MTRKILIVGAGFAGAVVARELADAGASVQVIDQRAHIGGNAYDEMLPCGTRVHRYGPHLFHTNNETVVDWLRRFSEFVPYQHRVQALLPDGDCVPLPINRLTVNQVFGVKLHTPDEVRSFLADQAEAIAEPANAAEMLVSRIGRRLTDLLFRTYTRKMWAMDLEELDAAVVQRIPIRFDDDDRYFPNDAFQLMPTHGYTALFEAMLDHPAIEVTLGQPFDKAMRTGFDHCFASMPIDEYFDSAFGPLPYRSIRFEHRQVDASYQRGTATVVNYTHDGPASRETDWSRLPMQAAAAGRVRTITIERPCADHENAMERYYPVQTSDGRYQALYERYAALAKTDRALSFIGRCGTYRYLDMHQVINQSRQLAAAWLRDRGT